MFREILCNMQKLLSFMKFLSNLTNYVRNKVFIQPKQTINEEQSLPKGILSNEL